MITILISVQSSYHPKNEEHQSTIENELWNRNALINKKWWRFDDNGQQISNTIELAFCNYIFHVYFPQQFLKINKLLLIVIIFCAFILLCIFQL